MACYSLATAGGYGVIIYCQLKLRTHLRRVGYSMRKDTREMHAEANRALVALVSADMTEWGPLAFSDPLLPAPVPAVR